MHPGVSSTKARTGILITDCVCHHVDRPGKMGVISCEWFRILFAYLDTGIVHAKSVILRFFQVVEYLEVIHDDCGRTS